MCVCVQVEVPIWDFVELYGPGLSIPSLTMYHAVRKLFFTDCRCAGDASKTYEELFARLDTNKDGKVDVAELKAGLAAMGIKTGKGAAQVESHSTQTGLIGRESTQEYCVLLHS